MARQGGGTLLEKGQRKINPDNVVGTLLEKGQYKINSDNNFNCIWFYYTVYPIEKFKKSVIM